VGWYLRFSLSYRDVEELLSERGIPADHTTVWRWVQRYAIELHKRCRRELKPTNRSWRVDETYIRVKGKWVYLYRAVDSTGATVDFLLSAHRDAGAAKRFFQKALRAPGHPRPKVINVDGNPSYPKAVAELKTAGKLGRRCRCRTCPYLNNIVEQDHRAIKRRVNASQGFRSFQGAGRTIQGYEAVHMIRKGQVRWLPKGDVAGLVLFINETLGLRAE
jgi:transposase-like protein